MPRVFGAFLNQNQAVIFTHAEVRRALNSSVDKQALVDEVLKGYGFPLSGPIPSEVNLWQNDLAIEQGATTTRIDTARKILTDAGWKNNKDGILEKKIKSGVIALQFSLSTSDAPELKQTAEILATVWNSLGARVDVKIFEAGDLNQNVIKPRKYDVLLFGEVIGKDMDFYPFWHSSQRNDPGLNISQYANITADKLLEEMRETTSASVREAKLKQFDEEIKKDLPTIFTYAPKFIYVISPEIKNVTIPSLANQSDRFLEIEKWYIETDNVWSIFAHN
ncbi:MAG: ABC transporter substrate-binding protein, partial [Patescibacteria group bacterium]